MIELDMEALRSSDVAFIRDKKTAKFYVCLVPGHTLEQTIKKIESENVKYIELLASDITEFKEETNIEVLGEIIDFNSFIDIFCSATYKPLEEIGNPYTPKQPNAVYIPPHIAKRQKRQKGKGLHF